MNTKRLFQPSWLAIVLLSALGLLLLCGFSFAQEAELELRELNEKIKREEERLEEAQFRAQLAQYWQLPEGIPASIEPRKPTQADLEQALVERKQAEQAAAESEEAVAPAPQIGIGEFLAIGQASLDVIFFSYSREENEGFVDGQTRGIFSAKEVIRTDEYQLEIKQMEAELFGRSSASSTTWVSVEQGNWYLPLNLLLSESRTEIRRSNMRIVGQGCRYSSQDELMEIYGKTYSEFYRIPAETSEDPLDPRSSVPSQPAISAPVSP